MNLPPDQVNISRYVLVPMVPREEGGNIKSISYWQKIAVVVDEENHKDEAE